MTHRLKTHTSLKVGKEQLEQHIHSLELALQEAVDKDWDHHAVIVMGQIDILTAKYNDISKEKTCQFLNK